MFQVMHNLDMVSKQLRSFKNFKKMICRVQVIDDADIIEMYDNKVDLLIWKNIDSMKRFLSQSYKRRAMLEGAIKETNPVRKARRRQKYRFMGPIFDYKNVDFTIDEESCKETIQMLKQASSGVKNQLMFDKTYKVGRGKFSINYRMRTLSSHDLYGDFAGKFQSFLDATTGGYGLLSLSGNDENLFYDYGYNVLKNRVDEVTNIWVKDP